MLICSVQTLFLFSLMSGDVEVKFDVRMLYYAVRVCLMSGYRMKRLTRFEICVI
jgi:hypothetical protein